MSIEEQYYKDFQQKEYNDVLQILWENHCKYPAGQKWPPSLEEIKKEIQSNKWSSDR